MKNIGLIALIIVLLSSCSSAQFAKRKHRKGFYTDFAFSKNVNHNVVESKQTRRKKSRSVNFAEVKEQKFLAIDMVEVEIPKKEEPMLISSFAQNPIKKKEKRNPDLRKGEVLTPLIAVDGDEKSKEKSSTKSSSKKAIIFWFKIIGLVALMALVLYFALPLIARGFSSLITGSPNGMGFNFGGGGDIDLGIWGVLIGALMIFGFIALIVSIFTGGFSFSSLIKIASLFG